MLHWQKCKKYDNALSQNDILHQLQGEERRGEEEIRGERERRGEKRREGAVIQ